MNSIINPNMSFIIEMTTLPKYMHIMHCMIYINPPDMMSPAKMAHFFQGAGGGAGRFKLHFNCQVLVKYQVPGAVTWHLNFQVAGAL